MVSFNTTGAMIIDVEGALLQTEPAMLLPPPTLPPLPLFLSLGIVTVKA